MTPYEVEKKKSILGSVYTNNKNMNNNVNNNHCNWYDINKNNIISPNNMNDINILKIILIMCYY